LSIMARQFRVKAPMKQAKVEPPCTALVATLRGNLQDHDGQQNLSNDLFLPMSIEEAEADEKRGTEEGG
jgi:hypothetical protein